MALKDKLMTLEDFKAVRDVDVASNSAQFTELRADLGDVNNEVYGEKIRIIDIVNGKYMTNTGNISNNNILSYGFASISGLTSVIVDTTAFASGSVIINVCNSSKAFVRNIANWGAIGKYAVTVDSGEEYLCISCSTTNIGLVSIYEAGTIEASLLGRMDSVEDSIENINRLLEGTSYSYPILRNGSVGNGSNANAVTTNFILPIYKKYDKIYVEFVGDYSLANEYGLSYCLFRGASDGDTTSAAFSNANVTKKQVNNNFDVAHLYPSPRIPIEMTNISDYDHISVCMFRKLNGTYVPIRIATDQYSLKVSYEYNSDIPMRDIDTDDVSHISDNARHIKGNNGTPLTLLHFSDIHADTSALARIMKDAESYTLDGKICTGDISGNAYTQITSWWDASVMTCIGNHDSASYDASTGYNWTALSMANRDAYYITPFKSNWGVTHTTGESYYYKDYATQNVRLIVMDGMLYTDNGTDATAQTAWLADLLADAIINSLHVLIAIHAPHGGAVPVECSFSRYGHGTMPTNSVCNTPQVVIDTVATAIANGLHFIGYLVGHTHQDNIWDAEGDGKQLMYCVTCAHVSNVNQWKNSDQNRSPSEDAYNIVTADTTNTLVKIVRGGGADIDDHMRTRKAICIDYSTGDVVGEVL